MANPRIVSLLLVVLAALLKSSIVYGDVGRTEVIPAVSPSGAAGYTIPITVPPGVNDMTPELALSYNHRNTEGSAGVGWDISGLSTITRCAKSMDQDNEIDTVELETTDRLCADGIQLRLTSGTYGTAGSNYREELDSITRYSAFGTAGNGPQYFKAEAKNGLIYYYGNSSDSRIESLATGYTTTAIVWALNKIVDRAGNEITFHYEEDGAPDGEYRIDHIDYGGNPGQGISARYSVEFNYSSLFATDEQLRFVAGGKMEETNVLTSIQIKYTEANPDEVYRAYNLGYELNPSSTGRGRLDSVTECAELTTNCYSPTTFTYQDGSVSLASEVSSGSTIPSGANALALDINGDGHMDLAFGGSGSYWKYRLANTTGGFGSEQTTTASNTGHSEAIVIDYDADGLEDILYPKSGGTWWVVKGTSSGLSNTVTNTSAPDVSTNGNAAALDMDGDGLEDLVYAENASTAGSAKLMIRYRELSGNFSSTATTLYTSASDEKFLGWVFRGAYDQNRRNFFDVNGDGVADVALRTRRDFGWPEPMRYFYTKIILGAGKGNYVVEQQSSVGIAIDMNGDGYTDIVYKSGGAVKFRLSNGKNLASAVTVPSMTNYNFNYAVALDYDSDGLQDILVPTISTGTNTWYFLRSRGDAFDSPVDTTYSSSDLDDAFRIDQNGDGLDDLAYVSGTTNEIYKTRNHAGDYPDLLETAEDGFGNSTTFEYTTITEDAYTKTGTATFPLQKWIGPMQVVKTAEHTDGIGGTYIDTYAYTNALMNFEGRGLGGFETRTITDSRNSIKTTETYEQEFPYRGRLDQILVEQSDGKDIQHKDYTWNKKTGGTGTQDYHHPYVSQLVEKNYEIGGTYNGTHLTTETTDYTVDLYGTPTTIEVTTNEQSGAIGLQSSWTYTTKVVHTSMQNVATYWCVGKAGKTQWINSYTTGTHGTAITRTVDRVWDTGNNCRQTSQTTENLSDHKLVQTFGYDSFGNISSDTKEGLDIDGVDMADRVTSVSWGSNGHFPQSITNAESEVTTFTWDYGLGERSVITDPNNLSVTTTFDDFGRISRITRPDGTYTDYVISACNSGNSYCSTSYSQVKTKLRVTDKQTNGTAIRYVDHFLDMLDREVQTESQVMGGSLSRTRNVFDDEGRLEKQYFPTFAAFTASADEYANAVYDLIGRPTEISRPIDSSTSTRQTVDIDYLGMKKVVTDPLLKVSTKIYDAVGRVYKSEDDDSYAQTFNYDAFGSLVNVTDSDTESLFDAEYAYGARAFQTESAEPNSGTWTFEINSFGEVEEHTDANLKTFTATYDKVSRQKQRVDPANTHTSAMTTTWAWGTSAANHNIGKLVSVTAGSHSETYAYDSHGRQNKRTTVSDTTYVDDYTYNSTTGLLETHTFPDSVTGSTARVKLKYEYDYGYTQKIVDHGTPSTVYWEAESVDARGNIIHETLENGKESHRSYDGVTGLTDYIDAGTSGGLQDLEYSWNKVGSLAEREDVKRSLTEKFTYDDLHRLDYSELDQGSGFSENLNIDYAANGNITKNTNVSTSIWTYDSTQIHAVKTAGSNTYSYDANGNQTQRNSDDVEWYSYNLPSRIENGSKHHDFFYDGNRRRWKEVYDNGSAQETTIYVGDDFEKRTEGSISFYRHQIYADGRLVAVRVRSNVSGGTDETKSILTDHLGSIVETLNHSGSAEISISYMAFGERRDPTDWDGTFPDEPELAETSQEGFTGHTHLDSSPLIHMGGRVMDAELGRFISADPYVPHPNSTQSFNRYSYVRNNPLSAIDPSGFVELGWNDWDFRLNSVWTWGGRKRQPTPKPTTGCIKANPAGCYGKPQAKSVFDMVLDAWNKPMQWHSEKDYLRMNILEEYENEKQLLEDIATGVFDEFILAPVKDLVEGRVFAAACKFVKVCRVLEKWGGKLFDKAAEKVAKWLKQKLKKYRGRSDVSDDVDYSRPSGYRKGVRDEVWGNAKESSTGQVRDPTTGRFMSKDDPWDVGHKPGHEFRKHQGSAQGRGISRGEFLDEHNDPSAYRPELPSSNRSHQGEDMTDAYFGT